MPQRVIESEGHRWTVSSTGRRTQYGKDEFTVCFTKQGAAPAEQRVARYSPLATKNREDSLAQLADDQLRDLLNRSQPAWTTPEMDYRR